jgi:hypothetical protein
MTTVDGDHPKEQVTRVFVPVSSCLKHVPVYLDNRGEKSTRNTHNLQQLSLVFVFRMPLNIIALR